MNNCEDINYVKIAKTEPETTIYYININKNNKDTSSLSPPTVEYIEKSFDARGTNLKYLNAKGVVTTFGFLERLYYSVLRKNSKIKSKIEQKSLFERLISEIENINNKLILNNPNSNNTIAIKFNKNKLTKFSDFSELFSVYAEPMAVEY